MIIATAGHVDHGKTALVKALTGVDTDSLAEEKARGLTINLGFAYTQTAAGQRLGFVDVPGHIRFINNMLAGVAGIDLALLVVAADDGIMPQTVEHLAILNLLEVSRGLVALTKTDRAEPPRVKAVRRSIEDLLAGTGLAGAAIYPVSAMTGEGVDSLQQALAQAALGPEAQHQAGLFRLAIDRSFKVKGAGLVVTGSVFSGEVHTGDELTLAPQGIPVRVRGLHTQNQAADRGAAGDRLAVNITSTEQLQLEHIHRGNWLTTNPAPATARFDALLRLLPGEAPLRHWTPVHLHTAANHATGRVAVLEHGSIAPGGTGLVQLVTDKAINLCVGDRLVVRDQAALRTLGGGRVINTESPARGRAKPERLALLQALEPAEPQRNLEKLLALQASGVALAPFAGAHNLALEAVLGQLPEGTALAGDGLAIAPQHLQRHVEQLIAKLDAWHKANPTKPGLPLNQLKRLFLKDLPDSLVGFMVEQLLGKRELQRQGNIWARPGHSAKLSSREAALFGLAEPLLAEQPTRPPVLHDLAGSLKVAPTELAKALDQAAKLGLVVRPVKNRYFLPQGMEALTACATKLAAAQGRFTVKDFRDASGIGRNLTIEILEYFDRTGITRRLGDERALASAKPQA